MDPVPASLSPNSVKLSTSPSAGSVLKKSTTSNLSRNSSGLSVGSQRVRIKRKHLEETPSPFEDSSFESRTSLPGHNENIPPALPSTLPKDYEEIARRLSGSLSGPPGHVAKSPNYFQPRHAKSETAALPHQCNMSPGHPQEILPATSHHMARQEIQRQSQLKQGTPTDKEFFSKGTNPSSDVRVTQFKAGRQKQLIKESLSKRSERTGPVKRVFEPRFVGRYRSPESDGDVSRVAATAAAAVAATAPLLKYQHDLEHKMSLILDKLHHLESKSTRPEQKDDGSRRHGDAGSEELQKRLDELTLLKLQELERLRSQQNLLQDQMITDAPSHLNNHPPTHHHGNQSTGVTREVVRQVTQSDPVISSTHGPPTVPMRGRLPMGHLESQTGSQGERRGASAARQVHYTPAGVHLKGGSRLPTEGHGGAQSHTGSRVSPLQTPAPRKHVPVPHRKGSTTQQPNGGLLQEILDQHIEPSPDKSNLQKEHRHRVPELARSV